MDWPTVTLLIVLLSVGLPMLPAILKAWRSGPRQAEEAESTVQALEQEVATLRERVATLEAIVTDDGYRLTQEIDRLESTGPEAVKVAAS
ncbi:MAG: hypothetical protein F4Y86_07745 [Gammaproteobacteria bacterium]|nr:hypothetical protein [Gammaproteobacteria bacterium]MXY52403.1 hypothetical protein [Gammaproteobacteria bacterium]MYB36526.1 hypothetical protein [Gammaproteobacteria bacterium]